MSESSILHLPHGWLFSCSCKENFPFSVIKKTEKRELSVSYLGQTPQKQVFLEAYRVKDDNLVCGN